MHTKMLRIHAVISAMLLLLSLGAASANAAGPATAKEPGQMEKKELQISKDGKTIVDQNGQEVARFRKGIQMKPTGTTAQKLQGCMCCEPECLIYDKNGVCIKSHSSCTWDFDCSCRK